MLPTWPDPGIVYYKDESLFETRVEDDARTFHPLGQKIHSYSKHGQLKGPAQPSEDEQITYEVYHVILYEIHIESPVDCVFVQAVWTTPGFREYHRRMQIFILLYIEAGSYISEEEDSWEFVVLWIILFSAT